VDAMNADPAFLRVRVRTAVLPALEAAAGPGTSLRLARFAAFAEEDARLLDALADGAWARLEAAAGELDAAGMRALEAPLRRRMLTRLLERTGLEVDAERLTAMLDALGRGGRVDVGRGWVLETAGGRLRLASKDRRAAPLAPPLLLAAPGSEGALPSLGWRVGWSQEEPMAASLRHPLPLTVEGPLLVRTRKSGDRLVRSDGHSRALQDVLVDARVPRERRDALPLFLDSAGRVLWVPGVAGGPRGHGGGWLWAAPAPEASDGEETPL
jgi:tRNA(Ile)-lysidine synthase